MSSRSKKGGTDDGSAGKLATQSDDISAPTPGTLSRCCHFYCSNAATSEGDLPRSVAIPSTNWPATSSGLTEDYTGTFDPTLAQVWSTPSFGFDFSDAAGATSFDSNQIFTPFEFGNVGFDANLPRRLPSKTPRARSRTPHFLLISISPACPRLIGLNYLIHNFFANPA